MQTSNGVNEKVEESSFERLKRVAEELNKTGANPVVEKSLYGARESRKENADFIEHPRQSRDLKENEISTVERPTLQKGEMNPVRKNAPLVERTNFLTGQETRLSNGVKIAGTILPDLIQEKMKLEKILQEMNNLKSKICQRIESIKTMERREKELNQQLASARKEDDFPGQIKESFENLKENIKF